VAAASASRAISSPWPQPTRGIMDRFIGESAFGPLVGEHVQHGEPSERNLGVGTSARALLDESVLTVREAGSWHWSPVLTRSTILQLPGQSITCGLRV
jgi:hypothetical protein